MRNFRSLRNEEFQVSSLQLVSPCVYSHLIAICTGRCCSCGKHMHLMYNIHSQRESSEGTD